MLSHGVVIAVVVGTDPIFKNALTNPTSLSF